MQDKRIDRATYIIDRRIRSDFDEASLGVDLNLADVTAEWESGHSDCLVAFCPERAAQVCGQIISFASGSCNFKQADRAIGTSHLELSIAELNVRDVGLKDVSGELARLGDDQLRCPSHDNARH